MTSCFVRQLVDCCLQKRNHLATCELGRVCFNTFIKELSHSRLIVIACENDQTDNRTSGKREYSFR